MGLAPQHQAAVDAAPLLTADQLSTITALFNYEGRRYAVVETDAEGPKAVAEFTAEHLRLCGTGEA